MPRITREEANEEVAAAIEAASEQPDCVDHAYRVTGELGDRGGERRWYEVIDGVLIDLITALAIVAVYEALSPAGREQMRTLSLERAAFIAWRLVTS